MRILLDDEPSNLTGDTVAEAIAAAADRAREEGRLIVEVVVDGHPWSSDQLDNTELIQSVADEVRMVTAEPRELAVEVLADAAQALDAVDAHQVQAAEMIQAGRTSEGLTELNEGLSIWLSIQQAVEQACELMDVELESFAGPDGPTAGEVLTQLQEALERVREMLAAQDVVGVADVLLYDLPSVLQAWRETLTQLSKEISGR